MAKSQGIVAEVGDEYQVAAKNAYKLLRITWLTQDRVVLL